MRKSIITVSLLAVIISFSACVTVDAASQKVMNDIDSIGEVELSDKALIEKIEYTYSTLTEKQKEQVKNYVVLLRKRD